MATHWVSKPLVKCPHNSGSMECLSYFRAEVQLSLLGKVNQVRHLNTGCIVKCSEVPKFLRPKSFFEKFKTVFSLYVLIKDSKELSSLRSDFLCHNKGSIFILKCVLCD